MLPTRRLALLLLAVTAISIGSVAFPAARGVALSLDVLLLALASIDALLGRGTRISVEREVPAVLSVGRAHPVVLRLVNRSGRALEGLVSDDPVEDTTAEGLPLRFALKPRATADLRYDLRPSRRGTKHFGSVNVRYACPLGLTARQERTRLEQSSDVYPDVHAARALELLRRVGRQDARVGSLRVRGGDAEFERLRPYQRGDEIRHIDWRASARHADLVVRQYQAESNQNVVFAIDVGRSMRGYTHGLAHIDYALNAALLTADVALRAGDNASLFVFDDTPKQFVPPTGGRSGGRKLTRAAFGIEAGLHATDYRAAVAFLKTQLRSRSLFIFFTNLIDIRSAKELTSALRTLLPTHLPLCVLFKDLDIEDLAKERAETAEDLYVRAAAAETLNFRDGIIQELRNLGVLVLDATPGALTPELVRTYLETKARRLL